MPQPLRPVLHAVRWIAALMIGASMLHAEDAGLTPAGDQGLLEARGQGVFDQKGDWHVSDTVHLVIPGTLELWCDDFTIKQATDATGRRSVQRIVARTNVVMNIQGSFSAGAKSDATKPETNRVTAFQAVFDAAQGTVELTGAPGGPQPEVEGPERRLRGERLVFDRARGRFLVYGPFQQVFKATAIKDIFKSTNAPSVR